jgi:hypothetical protein
MMDIGYVNWWVRRSTDTKYFFIILIVLILLFVMVNLLRKRSTQKEKEGRFYSVVDRYKLKDVEEHYLIDLVEKYNLEEPEQILIKKDLFDQVAGSEMDSILAGKGSMKEKISAIDNLYILRNKTRDKLHISQSVFEKEN